MRLLVGKWSLSVAILFLAAKLLQYLRRLGWPTQEDGWRRTTRALFRDENAKFILTAFHLHVGGGKDQNPTEIREHLIRRLSLFLKKNPDIHWRLRWWGFFPHKERMNESDLIRAEFTSDGRLIMIEPYLDPDYPIKVAEQDELYRAIIDAYNAVNNTPDHLRPYLLFQKLCRKIREMPDMTSSQKRSAVAYGERIIAGNWIHFAEMSLERETCFEAPEFTKAKHPGHGLFNIHCRLDTDLHHADLWIQVSHILLDGVPIQEVLTELKRDWGGESLVFPAVSNYIPKIVATTTAVSKEKIYQAIDFIDFRPLLSHRKKLNERFAGRVGGEITILSLLAWNLAHFPAFSGRKFLFPIDLSAIAKRERTVGLGFIRPADFMGQKDSLQAFLGFQNEFNRCLSATRERRSESYELAESFALVPPGFHSLTSRLLPSAMAELTGTVGLSIIKEAEVFLSPISDAHHLGFLAFGNFLIPTVDGGRAGAVCVSGTYDRVVSCLQDLRNAVNKVPIGIE